MRSLFVQFCQFSATVAGCQPYSVNILNIGKNIKGGSCFKMHSSQVTMLFIRVIVSKMTILIIAQAIKKIL